MKKGVFSHIFQNFWYKIFALFLAVVVWSMIQGEQILEVDREITVSIEIPEGYMTRGDLVRVKAATVKGPRVLMIEAPENLEATIRVPKGKVGKYRIRIDKDDIIGWSDRLKLTIHDPYLTLFIDRKMTRRLPIKEVLQGTPADGHIIKKVTLKPSNLTVTGLRSELIKLRHINTEPVNIAGIQENVSIEAALIAPGPASTILSIETATVLFQVGDSKVNKRFGSIPVEVEGSEFQTKMKPRYVTIVIQGTASTLNFVTHRDLKAFVDARGLAPGRYEQDIKVKIPPSTVLIETFPEKGTVTILDVTKAEGL